MLFVILQNVSTHTGVFTCISIVILQKVSTHPGTYLHFICNAVESLSSGIDLTPSLDRHKDFISVVALLLRKVPIFLRTSLYLFATC